MDNISYFLENANSKILQAINKKMDVNEFIEQSKIIWKSGITPLTSVIFGYPQETPETIQHTLDVCYECNIYPSVGFLLPLPGTEIYQWALNKGKIKNELEYLMKIGDRQDFHINLTEMEDDKFVETVNIYLEKHAEKLGLKFDNPLKTTTYQKPKLGVN